MEVVLHESTTSVSCDAAKSNTLNQSKSTTQNGNTEKMQRSENSLVYGHYPSQQRMPIDITFENVSYTAIDRSKQGHLPSFLSKQGKCIF